MVGFLCTTLLLSIVGVVLAKELCTSKTNTFTVKVNLHASERGYFYFEECGDQVNPTLGLEFGEVYTFIQKDRTNYWHPLSFSYFPDAHHVGGDVLRPGTVGQAVSSSSSSSSASTGSVVSKTTSGKSTTTTTDCTHNMTCSAPMYFLNDGYLGSYSNIPSIKNVTTNEDDNGIAVYEDLFFKKMSSWVGFGTFSVKLKFDDESYTDNDIFYYCHIHQFMSGRIKLLQNGIPVAPHHDEPPLYYQVETPGEFDRMCGTYGLDAFQLPHPQCPSRFVCDVDEGMRNFASCIDAMDCHMVTGMTTKVSSGTELALFLHQMIPHHQNAVNMAKALLHAASMPCDDLTNEEDPYCIMQGLLYGIVNRQNFEIGIMSNVLAAMNLPRRDDCEVRVPNNHNDHHQNSRRGLGSTAAGAVLGAAAHFFQ